MIILSSIGARHRQWFFQARRAFPMALAVCSLTAAPLLPRTSLRHLSPCPLHFLHSVVVVNFHLFTSLSNLVFQGGGNDDSASQCDHPKYPRFRYHELVAESAVRFGLLPLPPNLSTDSHEGLGSIRFFVSYYNKSLISEIFCIFEMSVLL